jgi:hypothetical protein
MDFSKHLKIIKDMDEKIMNGERLSDDLIQTLTALRDAVAQSEAHSRKMADRVNAMKEQVDLLKWTKNKLTERVDKNRSILEFAQRHYTKKINVANRRAGIWKAKVERLKAKGAK